MDILDLDKMSIPKSDQEVENNVLKLRQQLSKLDSNEAKAACEVMMVLYPDEYLTTLKENYILNLTTLNGVNDVMRTNKEKVKEILGGSN